MWAQSMLEYGLMSTLIDAFSRAWSSARDFFLTLNPAWYVVPILVYLVFFRKR